MALRNCSAAHCGSIDAELNEVCKQEGWAVGHPVITRDAQGPCQCHCSCLALDTPVAATWDVMRSIQDFKVGDTVLAAGADLKFTETEVKFSDGTTGGSAQPYSIFIEYGDKSLIVTADHLFFMPNGKLKRADRLSIEDSLVAPDGSEVQLTSVSMGTFYGGFHHIATSIEDPQGNLDGHLLNVNGVVTTDYVVQLFHRTDELDRNLMVEGHEELPIVGSAEYIEKHGEIREPEVGRFVEPKVMISDASQLPSSNQPLISGRIFVPMSRAKVRIPDDALNFISREDARRLARFPKRPLTASDAQAWAGYLVTQHKAFYSAVSYEIDWYNEEVNAYAWRDANGVGHVALLGGLIRFPAIEVEGLALITAHELGHLYGGAPFYQGTTLSCEGQADFFGARNVMRRVWFGESYFNMMIPAIRQLAEFFGVPPLVNSAAVAGACTHPPGPCRIETYQAGLDLAPKPACAG